MKASFTENFKGMLLKLLTQEVEAHKLAVDNPNVIKFYEIFDWTDETTKKSVKLIILEYCNNGTLEDYLRKQPGQKISEDQAIEFMRSLVLTFAELHKSGVIHRDVKPANILLKDKEIKLADFGFAKFIEDGITNTSLGSPPFMAPEILDEKPYSFAADAYSFGVNVYLMLHGKFPFMAQSKVELLKKIKAQKFTIDPDLSQNMKGFLRAILKADPEQRLS